MAGVAAMWRGVATGALLAVGLLASSDAGASNTPQYWIDNCETCHGSPVGLTPRFGVPEDARILTQRIDLSASGPWLASRTTLATHINGVNAVMTALATLTPDPEANAELGLIRQYLLDVRDAVMPTSVAGFGDTVIGGPDSTNTLQIQNTRVLPLAFTVTRGGGDAGDFSVSGCGLSGAGTGGSVPAVANGVYVPSSCTLTITFHPLPGATVTRNATLSVAFSGNESGNPPTRSGIVLQGFARPPLEITSPAGGTASFTTAGPGTTASSTVTIKDRVGNAIQICRRSAPPLDGKTSYTFDPPLALPPASDCVSVAAGFATAALPRTINVGVTFAPGAVTTPLNAKLEVQGAGPDVLTVNLSGNAGPVLTVDALSLFGATNLEADGSVSADLSLSVSNRGSQSLSFAAIPLIIADSTLAGGTCGSVPLATNTGEYSVVANSCGAGLAAFTGATPPSCSVTLRFNPNGLGKRCGVLTIATTDAGLARIVLEGSGFNGPRLVVKEGATTQSAGVLLDFTSQRPGVAYPARTFTLTNGGTLGNLSLLLPAVDAVPGFTVTPGAGCAQPLLPFGASSCTLSIAFAPTLLQAYSGGFAIQSRPADAAPADPYASFAVNVVGIGTDRAPVLSWRNAANAVVGALDFGTTAAGSPVDRQVVLSNAGPGGARLNVVNVIGVDGVNFEVLPSGCSAETFLGEGKSCDVTIRFAPGGAGTKTANAQLISDGNGPGALALQGQGTGSAAPGALSLSSLPAFGTVRVGAQSAPLEATLANGGNFPLQVTSVDVVGPFKVQMLTCAAPPFTLTPGSSCRAAVMFEPTTSGAKSGTLRITTDASSVPTEIALSGDAQEAPDVSSGGCTLGSGNPLVDPIFYALLIAAIAILWLRRRSSRRTSLSSERGVDD